MTSKKATKSALLGRTLPESDVEIPGVGTVRVRGITRGQYLHAGRAMAGDDPDVQRFEKLLITAGMVDPALSEDEVGQWQRTAGAGEIARVVEMIQELSGARQDAPKSGV